MRQTCAVLIMMNLIKGLRRLQSRRCYADLGSKTEGPNSWKWYLRGSGTVGALVMYGLLARPGTIKEDIKIAGEKQKLKKKSSPELLKKLKEAIKNPANFQSDEDSLENESPISTVALQRAIMEVPTLRFTILDGMQGIGKTTAMLQLCQQVNKEGNYALFLSFGSRSPGSTSDLIICNPYLLFTLANDARNEGKTLLIVVDDLQHLAVRKTNSATDIMSH